MRVLTAIPGLIRVPVAFGWSLLERVASEVLRGAGVLPSRDGAHPAPAGPEAAATAPAGAAPARGERRPARDERARPGPRAQPRARRRPPPPPPPPAEAKTVDEEPVLAGEFAEPGAEDGAGPQLRVEEPWEGYARMSARDVVAVLSDAGPEVVAAVRLYEATHKGRRSVLQAADRRLRD